MSKYDKEAIQALIPAIQKQGFRVFLADRGTYGFFTDAEGSRVVSFGHDLLTTKFGGNYQTSNPARCGTGWRIASTNDDDCSDFDAMFNQAAPRWATDGATWRYTTLQEHLKTYQDSSKYQEQE